MCWRHDVPYILWLLAGGVVCRAVGLCWLGNILIPDGFCSGRCNPIVTEFRATDRPVLVFSFSVECGMVECARRCDSSEFSSIFADGHFLPGRCLFPD